MVTPGMWQHDQSYTVKCSCHELSFRSFKLFRDEANFAVCCRSVVRDFCLCYVIVICISCSYVQCGICRNWRICVDTRRPTILRLIPEMPSCAAPDMVLR